ncbi:MAG TPA: DegT/DnrJ/EryC1/StrS family aminotransferase [Burkholderiaceae bacterium]
MADPHFSEEDRKWIHREIDVILDGALSMGPNVQAFEREFADRVGVAHAIAMNSCTSVLEAALFAKGATGREVIVPAETFIATGMAVHLVGGTPVFAEISESTLCLDLEDVKRRVTPQTAGVTLVHMAGLITPDILEFRQFCDEHGLFLIEDAAHSPGARLNNREAGSFGHVGCFSFFPTKVMTSGEGGMLTTNDEQVATFARSFQHRGRDMQSQSEQYIIPGRNVRMTEMSALLGRVQLSHLDEFLTRRRQLAAIYVRELSEQPEFSLVIPETFESSSFWKFPVVLGRTLDRGLLTQRMSDAGIVVDWAYQPALHLQPVFRNLYGTADGMLPATEDILSRHVCLPCHPRMTDEDAIYVATTLKTLVNSLGKIEAQV